MYFSIIPLFSLSNTAAAHPRHLSINAFTCMFYMEEVETQFPSVVLFARLLHDMMQCISART